MGDDMNARISLVGFHVVTPALLQLVPTAERETPGSVIFRGWNSGRCIHANDIFLWKETYIRKIQGIPALYIKNFLSEVVGMRLSHHRPIPNQVEVWSKESLEWVPFLAPEPLQLFIPRAPGAYIRSRP